VRSSEVFWTYNNVRLSVRVAPSGLTKLHPKALDPVVVEVAVDTEEEEAMEGEATVVPQGTEVLVGTVEEEDTAEGATEGAILLR
jgi:hypothetical protein